MNVHPVISYTDCFYFFLTALTVLTQIIFSELKSGITGSKI
jgi:hypothetical protein